MDALLRDWLSSAFGLTAVDVPETIPLRILGLPSPIPSREVITSAFRRRVMEVHPDLQFAVDHPELRQGAEAALGERPEIRELVWAREVLLEIAPDPSRVTAQRGNHVAPVLPVTSTKCRKCLRELVPPERHAVWLGARGGWCWRCVRADDAARRRERLRRRRANRRCAGPGCEKTFTPSRADGQYCSHPCRQAAYRARVTDKQGDESLPRLSVTV